MADRRINSSSDMHRDHNHSSSDNLRAPRDKDDPPNSRLFIVCGKSLTENDFRDSFQRFGTIDEIWVVKDRTSGEPKGVTYIKFSKTSEAALAMEEMNGRCIGNHPRPLKVLIAHSREQGSRRDCNEEERLLRLFVVVPRTMSESELREHFTQFGDIDYVSIVKDKHTKESKGFAYVKYHRVSHAARAFENCDKSFKPVFADPRPPKTAHADSTQSTVGSASSTTSNFDNFAYDSHTPNEGYCKLSVVVSPVVNQDQLWKLFDLIPGLDYCELKRDSKSKLQGRCQATVVYSNSSAAMYAKEKLHGFEYPPGHRLIVRFDSSSSYDSSRVPAVPVTPPSTQYPGVVNVANMGGRLPFIPGLGPQPALDAVQPQSNTGTGPYGMMPPSASTAALQNNLATLAETIAQATSLIQAAGAMSAPGVPVSPNPASSSTNNASETYDPSYCSVKLPLPQPLAPMESQVAERLFIVCQPTPPPLYVLKDIFGRFGNLIDVYLLGGRSCGYAKYADKDCANRAQVTLHGQEVCGSRLKVMTAEPPSNSSSDTLRKRIRMEEQ